jgi:hypothetical protein
MRFLLVLQLCLPILTLALISNPTSVRLPFQDAHLLTSSLLLHNGSILIAAYDSEIKSAHGQIYCIDAIAPEMRVLSNFTSGVGSSYFVATSDSSMIYLKECNGGCPAMFHDMSVSSTGVINIRRTTRIPLNTTIGFFTTIGLTFIPSQNAVIMVGGGTSGGYQVYKLDEALLL